MAEFKFSCPQCGQHIQCDTGYGGTQIQCPACKQAIIVPQAPQASAPPPPPAPQVPRMAASPPPPPAGAPGLSTRQTTMAPAAGQRFSGAPGASAVKPKSKTTRNIIIVTAIVVVLAVLGTGTWLVVSSFQKIKTKLTAGKGNPAAMVPTPTAAANSAALDLMSKMHQAYTNLNSLSIEGSSMMVIDMSDVSAADVNPRAATNKNAARRTAANLPKGVTNATEVIIKLARPNQFMVQGKGVMDVGRMKMTNTVAVWSPGQTNYSLMMMGGNKRFIYSDDRESVMAAYNQGGSLASSVVQLFFGDDNSMAKFMTDWGQTEDQTVSGQDCYTVTGKMLGQKLKLWINKANYLIVQSEVTLGAPVDEAQLEDLINASDKRSKLSTAQAAQQKAAAKMMAVMMTKIRGTATETYDTVQLNPSLTADDFTYPVPAGVKLTHGP